MLIICKLINFPNMVFNKIIDEYSLFNEECIYTFPNALFIFGVDTALQARTASKPKKRS